MGGHDPYSSSKGCAELVTSAMRRSFFADRARAVASARAGNVIGGGDWAEDRLVPDLMRAAAAGVPVAMRNPDAMRPWQFVLEPLRGYLMLGRAAGRGRARLRGGLELRSQRARRGHGARSRPAAATGVAARRRRLEEDASGPHEATTLELDCTKARTRLGWEPVLDAGRRPST